MSYRAALQKLLNVGAASQVSRLQTARFCFAGVLAAAFTLCVFVFTFTGKGSDVFSWVADSRRANVNGGGFRRLLVKSDTASFSQEKLSKTLPGCLIIGARKCGTRALLEFLDLHPQVAAARREMHFFDFDENYTKGLEWYRDLMPPSRPGQMTLEKTPRYLVSEITPSRVHRMNSSIRLVVVLRNPVARAVSDYTQLKAHKAERGEELTEGFEERAMILGEVNPDYAPIRVSTYHLHVARWLELFPRQQIHFVDGERLVSNPLKELRRLEKFLGLPRHFTEDIVYFNATRGFYCMRRFEVGKETNKSHSTLTDHCLGSSKGRKHDPVEPWVLEKLKEYFQVHNEILFNMIGQRFNWRS